MVKRRRVIAARSFEGCLEGLRTFLGEEGTERFGVLLDELQQVMPLLAEHPAAGRLFTSIPVHSAEGAALLARIVSRLNGREVREYVLRDHLLLYLVAPTAVYLLAIRHHRQLSFDFARLWR